MSTLFVPLVSLLLLSTSLTLHAATMRAGCYLQGEKGGDVEGVNVDQLYEIASVSKIMTSYWGVKTMGYSGRFSTTFYLHKVDGDTYDVHVMGSRDPFTGLEMLQYSVGELNRLGVKRVRRLSFDENFKFLSAVRSNGTAEGHYNLDSPSDDRVQAQLRSSLSNLMRGYPTTVSRARSVANIRLPDHISLPVSEVRFLRKAEFDAREFDSAYIYKSAPLHVLLKEMNRNSNNHAANQVFEALGGSDDFTRFIKADMALGGEQIRFVNGSGDRFDRPGDSSVYNEASCRSVVKIVRSLQIELKRTGHVLQDIMALAGNDALGEKSIVSQIYDNGVTHNALVAKTGTVSPSVTLAGMISTDDGEIFFGYIYGTRGTAADWRDGRNKMRTQVVHLMNTHGGRAPLPYSPAQFLPFDGSSTLTKLENRTAETRTR